MDDLDLSSVLKVSQSLSIQILMLSSVVNLFVLQAIFWFISSYLSSFFLILSFSVFTYCLIICDFCGNKYISHFQSFIAFFEDNFSSNQKRNKKRYVSISPSLIVDTGMRGSFLRPQALKCSHLVTLSLLGSTS